MVFTSGLVRQRFVRRLILNRWCSNSATTQSTPKPSYRVRYSDTPPAELSRPISELHTCSKCRKVFASSLALMKHESQVCAKPFQCATCLKKFVNKGNLKVHERLHLPFREQFVCPICGDVFMEKSRFEAHCAEYPGHHTRARGPRHLQTSQTMLTNGTFFGKEPIIAQSMSHVTTLHSQNAIIQDQRVTGVKNSTMILDGPLLHADAPPCAHFRIVPHSFGPLDISSFVPKRAEPGEVCTRLMVPLDVLSDEATTYRAYLVSLGNESYRSQSGIRATILFARERWWEWADAHCQRVDISTSDLLSRDADSGLWSVATKFRVSTHIPSTSSRDVESKITGTPCVDTPPRSSESVKASEPTSCGLENDNTARVGTFSESDGNDNVRKLSCTIVVADGLECDPSKVEWQRVFRVHAEDFVVICPLCHHESRNYTEAFEHEKREHQGRVLVCDICGDNATFRRLSSFRTHYDTLHEGLTRFECSQCDYKTNRQYSLSRHVVARHSQGKKRNMRNGRKTQDSEKMHRCPEPECKYHNAQKKNLVKHMERHHMHAVANQS